MSDDGTPIDSLARRVNHRVPANMEFLDDDINPYAQLELIAPVRAGQQLFADYGPNYAYNAHGFARYTGAGLLEGPPASATQLAHDQLAARMNISAHKWIDAHFAQ